MTDIRIDVGVYTTLKVDLTDFDFAGVSKVIFTAKNIYENKKILEREFETAEVHYVIVTPKESRALRNGAEYDFDILTVDNKRYKLGDNGKIVLRQGVGTCELNGSL